MFTPKRANKKQGYVAGAPFTKLTEFNPTSRQHIAWALQTFVARFTHLTAGGPRLMRPASLRSETLHFSKVTSSCMMSARCLFVLSTLQKWLGQLLLALTLGSIQLSKTAASITAAHLLQTGRNAHRGPNLGQVVSAPWARQLFIPHPGMVMVGADLEGLSFGRWRTTSTGSMTERLLT